MPDKRGKIPTGLVGVRWSYKPSIGTVKRTLSQPSTGLQVIDASYGAVADAFGGWVTGGADPSALTVAGSRASIRLVQAYKKAVRQVTGGSALAELGSTIRGLRNPLLGLRRGVSVLASDLRRLYRTGRLPDGRRINVDKRRQLSSAVTATWLEWSFGVKPLISDLNDGFAAARRISGHHTPAVKLYAEGEHEIFYNLTQVGVDAGPNLGAAAFVERRNSAFASVTYRGALKLSPTGELSWQQVTGLSLDDFLPSAWEAVPWSFLVDYFVNATEVLELLNFRVSNLAYLNASIRYGRETRQSDLINLRNESGGDWAFRNEVTGGRTVNRVTVVQRTSNATLFPPRLEFNLGLGDIRRKLNLFSLLDQIRRGIH